MLGGETTVVSTKDEATVPLVEVCRSVRERLETIARALGGLREEIDRALHDGLPQRETTAVDQDRPSG